MGEKWRRNFAEGGDFHVTFGLRKQILDDLKELAL
jgi:hypothetical protein